uniref:Glyoxalase n=1 Tax=Ignisphaera aggregans TaxID=334771 RepID=A0A7C4FIA9_9CREN
MASCKDGFKRVAQIGIVVRDIEEALDFWCKLLKIERPRVIETEEWEKTRATYKGVPTRGRAKLAFIELDNVAIELIQPIDGPSTWESQLNAHGQGVHHIAFVVEDIDGCVKELENFGGVREQEGLFEGGRYLYADLLKTLGVRIELLQFFK